MNILLNLYALKKGGGQQVASNFIRIICDDDFGHNWYVYTNTGSELDILAKEVFTAEKVYSIRYSYYSRIILDKTLRQFIQKNRIDIIYNYSPILKYYGIPQVVRTVYSNLYFPEVDFWSDFNVVQKFKKSIIDYFRLSGTLKADGLIFENTAMMERADKLFQYPKENMKYVSPSVSIFDETVTNSDFEYLSTIRVPKVLYLSSFYKNKNITILPTVAKILKSLNYKIKFILSLDKKDPEVYKVLYKSIENFGVESYFEFIGTVKSHDVHQVVKASNAMILLSKLECFSSNIVESLHFDKALFISNHDWARSACKDASVYVDRDDERDIALKIMKYFEDTVFQQILKENRKRLYQSFNAPKQKVDEQVKFLEYIQAKSNLV